MYLFSCVYHSDGKIVAKTGKCAEIKEKTGFWKEAAALTMPLFLRSRKFTTASDFLAYANQLTGVRAAEELPFPDEIS
ncbi:MAG TPA: hypothetical protein DCG49_06200 [Ruminococcus sp.]|nr:hypothetical protein [Ruminococcus sp.]